MADPLLTTLCTICYDQPPKYRCPRDGVQYCSLQCARKHKSRASCSGIRDVTAYVPAVKLRTPAGIDHDYNFLSSIERKVARVNRDVEERGIILPGEAFDGRWTEKWTGDKLTFRRPGADGESDAESDGRDRRSTVMHTKVKRLCHAQGIEVEHMPPRMARSKENITTWNRRTGGLNWEVEFLFYEDGLDKKPTRLLRKVLDEAPIYTGFSNAMEWVLKGGRTREYDDEDGEEGPPPKKRKMTRPALRSLHTTPAWDTTGYSLQSPITTGWNPETRAATDLWDADIRAIERRQLRYFLFTPKTNPKELIPLGPNDTLKEILPGRMVVEFPTIYILPAITSTNGDTTMANGTEPDLPPGYIIGSTERKPPPPPEQRKQQNKPHKKQSQQPADHRSDAGATSIPTRQPLSAQSDAFRARKPALAKPTPLRGSLQQSSGIYAQQVAGKKRKVAFAGIQDLDEGEVDSDDETSSEGSTTSSSGSDEESSDEEEGLGLIEDVIEQLLEGQDDLEVEKKPKPLVVYDSWSEDEGE